MKNQTFLKTAFSIFLLGGIVFGIILAVPRTITIYADYVPEIILKEKAPIVSDMVYNVIQCESSWVETAKGDSDYIYPAHGLIQVQERTWKWLSQEMNFQGDINNPQDQVRFLTLALENGYGRYWSCFKKLYENNNF